MYIQRKNGATSNIIRVMLRSSATGQGLTGLSSASSGLIISTICDNEATPTNYTVAASNVETITTLGTFATPTASKCRFKEVDSTNQPGLYELQIADGRFGVSGAKVLRISITGATNLLSKSIVVQLTACDLDDAVRFGLSSLPNASAGANGGLPLGNAAGRVDVGNWLGSSPDALSSGKVPADLKLWLATAPLALSSQQVQAIVSAYATGKDPRAQLGMASANLDTQLAAITAKTSNLPNAPADEGAIELRFSNIDSNLATVYSLLTTVASYVDTEVAAILAAVDTEIGDILSRLPAALVGGRMDASVGAMASNTVTAAALASDASAEIKAALEAAGSHLALIKAVTDKLTTALELDGSVYRYTANALELAPTGSGGGGSGVGLVEDDALFSGRLQDRQVPASGANWLKFWLWAAVAGDGITPSGYGVQVAFLVNAGDSPTWHDAEVVEGRHALRRILIGTGGVSLSAGTYFVKLKIAASPETVYLTLADKVKVI